MTSSLHQWAIKWGVPAVALQDLQRALGLLSREHTNVTLPTSRLGEAYVQSKVRLEANKQGLRLWRNNVGALMDSEGRMVRYGLANDSKGLNTAIKSADLIGIRPVRIESAHVGHTIGQFVSRECKVGGWQYTGQPREVAQLAWLNIVVSLGGDAAFTTGEL